MRREASFPPGIARWLRPVREGRSAIALVFMASVALGSGLAQAQTTSLQLKPRQPQTLIVPLEKSQMALVHLHLHGGIVGVRETAPDGRSRPLWLIDLGRDATLTYVADGLQPGDQALEITSFEKARPAEISVEIDRPSSANAILTSLREAEDDLANAELIRRHWPDAPTGMDPIQLYDRAFTLAKTLDDTPLQRLILVQKARYFTFRQSRFTDASALLEQAVALPAANDAPQQALAWKTLSSVRYDLGEYEPAIKAGLTALDLYRKTNDVYWQGIVLGNLSSVYAEIGKNADALATAQDALKDAQDEQDTAGVVYCLSQLAGLYQQQGDLESALRTFYQGLAWVSEIGYAPLVEAEIQKNLGNFYTQIGDSERASYALQRCIELEKGKNDPISLEARGLLAAAMQRQGNLHAAVAEDTAAIEIARSLALKQDEAGLLLKRASVHLALHHPSPAQMDIKAAEVLATDLASLPLEVETEAALGDTLLPVNPKEAATVYRKALQLAESAGEREEQSLALAGLAKAFENEGQLEEAATSIEKALKIVEAARGSLVSRELQVTYFSMHRSWYELAVDICMQLNSKHPAKGYALLAFAYTERARARSLLDTLDSTGYSATIPVPESLREAYARNQREVTAQQALLVHSIEPAGGAVATKLQQLYREQEDLESQMPLPSDRRLRSLLGDRTADVARIQQQLMENHSILLSYWVGENHSYRWSITPNGVSIDVLPSRDQLERVLLPLEHMLQRRRPSPLAGEDISGYALQEKAFETQLQIALNRAGSILLSRIPKDVHTIFVVSDGCLMPLPFAALRISDGARVSYALRKYNFFREPSASTAVYLKQHSAKEQAMHITVFADPVFSLSDPRLVAHAQPKSVSGHLLFADMQRLTGSTKEGQYISQYVPNRMVTLRTGFNAAPSQVRNLSEKDAAILHFATHTVTVSGHPEITGIALSMWNPEGEEQDGVFWLKDIYALHLSSALVVLSGCETDKQNSDQGEGLNSLAYAFFFAGAHSVIGSLWAVDDTAASRLMEVFYRELLLKQERADHALREAQLKMLANPQTRSPTAWASFVLEGWPATYPIEQNNAKGALSPTSLSMKEK
jgi:CHAT domain-containing protein/tetratricopeptide (TPR) repeat protein